MSGPWYSDSWRDTYDAWKLATPPEYEWGDGEEASLEEMAFQDRMTMHLDAPNFDPEELFELWDSEP